MTANGKVLANGDAEGLVKIIAQKNTGEILGVGIVGAGAAELIAEATLAISAELTLEELAVTIHAHPTVAETFKEAVLAAAGRAVHIMNALPASPP
jgi:dihydrolipoamide dehydrogenase